MKPKFVTSEKLQSLLHDMLQDREVHGTLACEDGFHLTRLASWELQIPACRAVEPLKMLFFSARQNLGEYFAAGEPPSPPLRAVVGATACDLAALRILDFVFLEGDFVDPFYRALRERTLIVSVDCTEPREVCFCTFLGRKPYPDQGYDVNLSPVEGGYIVEPGSPMGVQLLEKYAGAFPEAGFAELEERKRRRAGVTARVEQQAAQAGLLGSAGLEEGLRKSAGAPMWEKLAEKCVECAACNFICPSCHCFLLVDLQEAHGFRRFKNWDACTYAGFAREASGANPRVRRAQRLHGRFEKKFDFMKANVGTWGCVGCGRCIEACAGKLDLRETLRELVHA